MADLRWDLDAGPRIEVFADQDAVGPDDVLDFWLREDALPVPEARERIGDVHLVAVDDDGSIAGVTSAYLRHVERLRLDMWHYRGFVAAAHRRSAIALRMGLAGRDHLRERFASGADTRGAGIVYEVENPHLKRVFPEAVWLPLDFTFIGENEYGDHVRVHWFAGAVAP